MTFLCLKQVQRLLYPPCRSGEIDIDLLVSCGLCTFLNARMTPNRGVIFFSSDKEFIYHGDYEET